MNSRKLIYTWQLSSFPLCFVFSSLEDIYKFTDTMYTIPWHCNNLHPLCFMNLYDVEYSKIHSQPKGTKQIIDTHLIIQWKQQIILYVRRTHALQSKDLSSYIIHQISTKQWETNNQYVKYQTQFTDLSQTSTCYYIIPYTIWSVIFQWIVMLPIDNIM